MSRGIELAFVLQPLHQVFPFTKHPSIRSIQARNLHDLPSTHTSTLIMLRQAFTRQARLFSTSVRTQKSAVDAAKDAVKNVDKTVSQTLVKGIETTGTS